MTSKQQNRELNDKFQQEFKKAMESPSDWPKDPFVKTKSITFDPVVQNSLPPWVKDKMKADRESSNLAPFYDKVEIPCEKLTANLPTKQVDLEMFQSPRGLREGKHRVETYDIKINKNYNAHELAKLVQYFNELVNSMEPVKLN